MPFRSLIPWTRTRAPALWREPEPFQSLRAEMNRLFDDFWSDFDVPRPAFGTRWPNLEITETDKEYRVTAEVPGLEEKDIEVKLDDDTLMISGEKRAETEDRDRRMSERYYGRFERRIPFDVDIDPDKVSASFKNGVLTVQLAKKPGAPERHKNIPIKKAA